VCIGVACWAIPTFYEFYYGQKFVSAATKAAIKLALYTDEANALKALEIVKESKMSFEAAYAKVFLMNQKAQEIAAKFR